VLASEPASAANPITRTTPLASGRESLCMRFLPWSELGAESAPARGERVSEQSHLRVVRETSKQFVRVLCQSRASGAVRSAPSPSSGPGRLKPSARAPAGAARVVSLSRIGLRLPPRADRKKDRRDARPNAKPVRLPLLIAECAPLLRSLAAGGLCRQPSRPSLTRKVSLALAAQHPMGVVHTHKTCTCRAGSPSQARRSHTMCNARHARRRCFCDPRRESSARFARMVARHTCTLRSHTPACKRRGHGGG